MYKLIFLGYNIPIIKEELIMSNKTHKSRIASAEALACKNYNLYRAEFIEKAAKYFPKVSDAKYFGYAVKHFDQIQHEINVYFSEPLGK